MEDIPREAGNRRWKNVVLNGDLEKLLLMCHHETLSAFCLVVQDRLSAAGNIVIEDQYARPDKKLGVLQYAYWTLTWNLNLPPCQKPSSGDIMMKKSWRELGSSNFTLQY